MPVEYIKRENNNFRQKYRKLYIANLIAREYFCNLYRVLANGHFPVKSKNGNFGQKIDQFC